MRWWLEYITFINVTMPPIPFFQVYAHLYGFNNKQYTTCFQGRRAGSWAFIFLPSTFGFHLALLLSEVVTKPVSVCRSGFGRRLARVPCTGEERLSCRFCSFKPSEKWFSTWLPTDDIYTCLLDRAKANSLKKHQSIRTSNIIDS